MTADMVASSSASEVYASSADVAEVCNTASLSATEVTNIIIKMQYFIDGKLRKRWSTPFSAGSVPTQVRLMCIWYSAQAVIEATYYGELASGSGGDLSNATQYQRHADELLRQILNGDVGLVLPNGTVVEPYTSEEEVVIYPEATPSSDMAPSTDIELVDIGGYTVIVKVKADSGTPSGIVKLFGKTDEGMPQDEAIYFKNAMTIESKLTWRDISRVDSIGVTGGTNTKVGVSGISKRSPEGGQMLAV